MTISFSNSLVGLSLLTGSNSFADYDTGTTGLESAALRKAKAAFTLPVTTPPWKEATTSAGASASAQLAAIRRMTSIIDKAASGANSLPDDVQTSFTAYKALDRLRILAESAARITTGSAERAKLDGLFARGLSDLQTFLGTAPTDRLDLSFGVPTRRIESVATPARPVLTVQGEGVSDTRDAPLPGLTGTEQFSLSLRKAGGGTDQVSVDLSQGTQPPTLDSIADQINAAIAAIPLRNPDGSLYTDENGQTQPRWLVRFVPDKSTGKWGFRIDNPAQEEVGIQQTNAADALVVAAGSTPLDAPGTVRMMRIDDPAAGGAQVTLNQFAAYDAAATERAKLAAPSYKAIDGVTLSQPHVNAATSAGAIATGPDGSTYVVGTAAGEMDANRPAGTQDLYLTRMDSEGRVMWQRMLGAAQDASGAAIHIDDDGNIVVAGTVTGAFDGETSDGDMLVARFNAQGEEQFATLVRSIGVDSASAVTSGADGSIYVGGRSGEYGGNAVIARLDADGRVTDRRIIDAGGTETVRALAMDGSGALLALTQEGAAALLRRIDTADLSNDVSSLSLGAVDARALAVSDDGSIAVGGARIGAGGDRDGFVARVGAALSSASFTELATSGTDEVDSIAFLNGDIYAGGRTTGTLGASRTGPTDGFVARIDAASGTQISATQFGQVAQRTEPVRLTAAAGGATALGALGLARGMLTPVDSDRLTAQTSLRAGDGFSVSLDEGKAKKISIAADETLTSLADKLRGALGANASISTPTVDGHRTLRIEAKAGHSIELIAGAAGTDALAKLGMEAKRLTVPEVGGAKDPPVKPGGTYGLALTTALSLATREDAAIAVKKIGEAISTTQTAYRSLYWDSGKAALVNARTSGSVSAYLAAQAERYQAALDRLTGYSI